MLPARPKRGKGLPIRGGAAPWRLRCCYTADSAQWRWKGHALVHASSIVHQGVNFFGPVLIGPDCEIGPNATIYGPTLVESGTYLGPGAEVHRSLLLAGAEVAHTSYVGHSVLGPQGAPGRVLLCGG